MNATTSRYYEWETVMSVRFGGVPVRVGGVPVRVGGVSVRVGGV